MVVSVVDSYCWLLLLFLFVVSIVVSGVAIVACDGENDVTVACRFNLVVVVFVVVGRVWVVVITTGVDVVVCDVVGVCFFIVVVDINCGGVCCFIVMVEFVAVMSFVRG